MTRPGIIRYRLWGAFAWGFCLMQSVSYDVLEFIDERRFRIEREWYW